MASADKETTGSATSRQRESQLPLRADAGFAFDTPPPAPVKDKKDGPARKRENSKTKSTRTRDKPRRPLSAYNYFFKEESARISSEVHTNPALQNLKGNPNELFKAVGRMVASHWKRLSSEEKKKYLEMADTDMERYESEKREYFRRHVRTTFESGVRGPVDGQFPTMGGTCYSAAATYDGDRQATLFKGGADAHGDPQKGSRAGPTFPSQSSAGVGLTYPEDICQTGHLNTTIPYTNINNMLALKHLMEVSEQRESDSIPGSFFPPSLVLQPLQLQQLQQQNEHILHRRVLLLAMAQVEDQRQRDARLLLRLRLQQQLGQHGLSLLSGLSPALLDGTAPSFGLSHAQSLNSSDDSTRFRHPMVHESLGAVGESRHTARSLPPELAEAMANAEQHRLQRGKNGDAGEDDKLISK